MNNCVFGLALTSVVSGSYFCVQLSDEPGTDLRVSARHTHTQQHTRQQHTAAHHQEHSSTSAAHQQQQQHISSISSSISSTSAAAAAAAAHQHQQQQLISTLVLSATLSAFISFETLAADVV